MIFQIFDKQVMNFQYFISKQNDPHVQNTSFSLNILLTSKIS